MRYFFHVVGSGKTYGDETGEEFADRESAMAHAARIARELAADDSVDGLWISVADEDGKEVGTLPITSG